MHKVLIVLESEDFRAALCNALQDEYSITVCKPGEVRVELLYRRYDVLVLDLYLPGTDGLTILKMIQDCRPPVVLMLTTYVSPYVMQEASDLGVGFIVRVPCNVSAVVNHLADLLCQQNTAVLIHPNVVIQEHLSQLGLSVKLEGYQQLRVGIPLFAQDPHQQLMKELYPAIGKLCGCSAQAVEHSIRDAIRGAWNNRNDAVWKEYFPDSTKCPTNKEFISTLAELLK